jgi:hypothetical protein
MNDTRLKILDRQEKGSSGAREPGTRVLSPAFCMAR